MYYLMNENKQIIGADTSLLKHLKVNNLNDFMKEVSLKNISFDKSGHDLSVTFRGHTEKYKCSETTAETLLGNVNIVYFEDLVVKEVLNEEPEHEEIDEKNIDFAYLAKKIGVSKEDYESFVKEYVELAKDLKKHLEDQKVEVYTAASKKISNLAGMLGLGSISKDIQDLENLDSVERKSTITEFYERIKNIFKEETPTKKDDSDDELEKLIKEEAAKAKGKKKEEPKKEEPKKEEPKKEEPKKEEPKKEEPKKEEDDALEIDFGEEIEVKEPKKEESKKEEEPEDGLEVDFGLDEVSKEDVIEVAIPEKEEGGLRPDIDLSSVEPVHFDFQMSHAADDLGIPVEIIEEFVLEYIDQAEEETVNLIQAYREGDLAKVQEIGHLLKGAASNLRIDPLAKTLYDIQFNEDLDNVEKLVKTYWAKFLSFRNQIKK